MATYNNVQIHPIPSKPSEQPKITVNVTTSNISRSGDNVSVKVFVSMNYLGGAAYFGYYIRLYAQLNNSSQVELFYKPNLPNRWNSGDYSGEATLTTSTTSSNATLKLFLKSNDDCLNNRTAQVWSTSISVPDPPAPTVTATSTTCTATQIGWSATSNIDVVEWSYKFQDKWYTYSGSARSSSKKLGVSGGQHSIQVAAKRASGQWGYSNVLKYDCRRPSINSVRLTITGVNKGSLSFSCSYDCQAYFNGNYLTHSAANTTTIKDVVLKSNSVSDNTLLVQRDSNSSLQSAVIISADTRLPSLNLYSSVSGTNVTLTAQSNFQMENWKFTFTSSSNPFERTIPSKGTSVSFVETTLIPGVTYTVTVTANRVDTPLEGSASTQVTPQGGYYIKLGDKYVAGTCYIWDQGSWKLVKPYIYNNDLWKECK